jgi:hypothetical protein
MSRRERFLSRKGFLKSTWFFRYADNKLNYGQIEAFSGVLVKPSLWASLKLSAARRSRGRPPAQLLRSVLFSLTYALAQPRPFKLPESTAPALLLAADFWPML